MEDEGCFLLSLCPRGTWSVTVRTRVAGKTDISSGDWVTGMCVCVGELYVNYLSGEIEWVDLGCDSLSVEVAMTPFGFR